MNIEEFLTLAAKEEASDLFIVAGLPLTMKVNGVMRRINEEKMMPQDTEKIIREIYEKALDAIEADPYMICLNGEHEVIIVE